GWSATPGGNVEVVVFRPQRSALRRVNLLLAGDVDLVTDVAVFDLHKVRKQPRLKLVQATELRTIFLGLDQGSVELRSSGLRGSNPFADKRVRQAMQMAIDLSAIQRVVMRGLAQPAGL